MTDKERILTAIIQRMSMAVAGSSKLIYFGSDIVAPDDENRFRIHRQPLFSESVNHLTPGDLVIAETSPRPSEFSVGFVHQVIDSSRILIREIGSNRICDYGNETFSKIVNLGEEIFEKDQYRLRVKVFKAFRRIDHFWHYYGGLSFGEKGKALLTVREKFGGMRQKSIPYTIELTWHKRTPIKEVVRQMLEQGFGKREFDKKEKALAVTS